MSQKIRIISHKYRKPIGIAINKNSIGTIWIGNRPYTYNADKVATNRINFDDSVKGINTAKAKKKIYIRRR